MRGSMRWLAVPLVLSGLMLGCAGLAIEDLLPPTEAQGPLDNETVIAGLKEALEIGAGRAIERTSVIDGFLGNELIRILMPESSSRWLATSAGSVSAARWMSWKWR